MKKLKRTTAGTLPLRTLLALVVAAILSVGLLVLVWMKPAQATFPGRNGNIVLQSNQGGQSDIWVMDPDGSQRKNLTNDKIEDIFPAWSPDGEKIAFRSLRDNNRDIYVMNADGTGEAQLTNDPAADFAPNWSPDGTKIAFASDRGGVQAVWTIPPDGIDPEDAQQLTPRELNAGPPSWSPDGLRVLFPDQFCATCTSQSDLFVINADGSGLTQITDTPENEVGKCSPDGKQIVADSASLPGQNHFGKGEIFVMNADGSSAENITNTPGTKEEHADWGPGRRNR